MGLVFGSGSWSWIFLVGISGCLSCMKFFCILNWIGRCGMSVCCWKIASMLKKWFVICCNYVCLLSWNFVLLWKMVSAISVPLLTGYWIKKVKLNACLVLIWIWLRLNSLMRYCFRKKSACILCLILLVKLWSVLIWWWKLLLWI